MANFIKLFQDEVRRLARKEAKDDVARLRKDNVELKRVLAQIRQRLAKLEQEKKRLTKVVAKVQPVPAEAPDSEADRARISSKTIRTLRARLGLTQAELADLVGVSGQSVYQWERRDGQLQLRKATKKAVVALKTMGAREAKKRLAEIAEKGAGAKPETDAKPKAKAKAKPKAKVKAKAGGRRGPKAKK